MELEELVISLNTRLGTQEVKVKKVRSFAERLVAGENNMKLLKKNIIKNSGWRPRHQTPWTPKVETEDSSANTRWR